MFSMSIQTRLYYATRHKFIVQQPFSLLSENVAKAAFLAQAGMAFAASHRHSAP